MSTKSKIWLIVAISLMLVGGIIFVGTMAALNWNFLGLNTTQYETNKYNVSEEFSNISINTDTTDVVFLKSDDGNCKIECFERENENHTVTVLDGMLKIDINDTRKWYDHITFFGFDTPQLKIYLPQNNYGALFINVSTGDIKIPDSFTFEGIDIKGSTGDVNCKASVTNDLKINISTGCTKIDNITADNINLMVSTGETYLTDVKCNSLVSSGDTGDIIFKNVDAGKEFNVTRSTGDIKFDQCDADELYIKTSTGDVEGKLCTSKIFICETNTGDIIVPPTTEGGNCQVITDTGDIKMQVKATISNGYFIR